MSSPYLYNPSDFYQQYGNEYHQTPYYYHTPRIYTPFLPPTPLPGSPRHPTTPLTSHIPFPSAGYDGDYIPNPTWDPRQRRPSWHGDWLQVNPPFRTRRHSSGNLPYPSLVHPWSASYSQFFINPWINATSPRQDFFFDLSSTAFAPLRLFGPGQSTILSLDEMREPATHPPLTRLRIICEQTPQWPIDLQFRDPAPSTPYSPYSPTYPQPQPQPPPPISLADVLVAIHKAMHRRISHRDWAKLNSGEERAITKAFTKRCGLSEHERAQGVKRVDFLQGKTRLVGLLRSGAEDGWEVMRLVLTE